jgi:hypothetical protein
MPEVEEDPLLVLEPRLSSPLDSNPYMGIDMYAMGVLILCACIEGKEVTFGIPKMETPYELGKDGVGPMALMDGKEC